MGKTTQSPPACGASEPPSAATERDTPRSGGPSVAEDVAGSAEILGAAGRVLEARGLRVRYFGSGENLADIEVSDPACAANGRISIGNDGYLIWERWGPTMGAPSAEAIVNIVVSVLTGHVESRAPAHESTVQ
jgi:hypothetical protein